MFTYTTYTFDKLPVLHSEYRAVTETSRFHLIASSEQGSVYMAKDSIDIKSFLSLYNYTYVYKPIDDLVTIEVTRISETTNKYVTILLVKDIHITSNIINSMLSRRLNVRELIDTLNEVYKTLLNK